MLRRPAALAGAAVVIVSGLAISAPSSDAALVMRGQIGAAAHGTLHKPVRGTTRPRATTLSRDGVQAQWVVAENKRPGTTAWEIPPGAATSIEGFASTTYAARGDRVTLYVSTTAPRLHVVAYRMGYYQGKGARFIWHSREIAGRRQPTCPRTTGTNMVTCDNWTPTLEFRITRAFVEGDYLLKLVGSGGQQSYVPLTVWDPTSTATYVVKNDVYTWQAWNAYGGYDFYAGPGTCPSGVYPLCTRARIVSFDRPYDYGAGAGDFLGSEYPLVRFVEQEGLDVTYMTDVTVQQHPALLLAHRTMVSLGHDECWSLTERQAAGRAEAHGVNMIFFGASAILRHVRLQASPLGADREEIDYRDSTADPLDGKGNPLEVTGNTWSSPPANWPEIGFVGEQYVGYLLPGAAPESLVVAPGASPWFLRGTGLHNGSRVPGVVTGDLDAFDPGDHPNNLEILAHSPVNLSDTMSELGAAQGFLYSDMTYWTDPTSAAGIFDSGATSWIASLTPCSPGARNCPASVTRRMTGNLLALFGRGPAGHFEPSVANWRQIYGSAT
ncbi:MAG TPA: N,N-dimethylformamidase beta subunit family domain-containing protein [Acidimicrobiales bacterium]|nr:N,N-dimethylformamidase beta subunit family domain-containing protein [Acidimicrobiales bacterium]